MKILSNERTEDYFYHIKIAAAQGAAVGAVAALGLRTFIKYRSPTFFQRAGGYQKGLIFAGPPAFCTITNMERQAVAYEQQKAEEALNVELGAPPKKSWSDFFMEHKYQTVVAGWAASMAGSFWLVNRDPFMTKAQKIVQARVYAQGLTVVMLLASVAFSVGSKDSETATKQKRDYSSRSWERDLEYVAAANKSSSKSA